ncbi:MAG TPA: BT_3928 family protein [Paludibacter sp.]|nr:BT_3928 family protein [Paludibacter sp.]
MPHESNNNSPFRGAGSRSLGIAVFLACFLLGAVFIFSGFVKAIDPLGSTYKFDDYFNAFGGIFSILTPFSFPLAILLSTLELTIGLALVLRLQLRYATLGAFLFMLVMTPLTFYIAVKNPVSDCGCFGDALIISNWATFFKNLFFIALAFFLLILYPRINPFFACRKQFVLLAVVVAMGLGLSAYCYQHLPLIDFLPYKVGVNIPEAMVVPDTAATDEYLTTFIYEKNGVQKEFTLENYPKGDSAWKFVDQKTILLKEGYKAPIHDFSIVDSAFEDITERVLYNPGYTYLLIMYDLDKASEKGAARAENLYKKARQVGADFIALTASSDRQVEAFRQKTGVTYPFCKTDPTTLKTIIRANPGVVLVKNGTIMGKWNWRDFE